MSLLGRAALFKKMTLPRFLYILQNTPHHVPDTYFKSINSALRTLLWDGGPARVAMSKLVRGWYDGGIALPDMRKYYWASHLAIINGWRHQPQEEPAYRMDKTLMHPEAMYMLYMATQGWEVAPIPRLRFSKYGILPLVQ